MIFSVKPTGINKKTTRTNKKQQLIIFLLLYILLIIIYLSYVCFEMYFCLLDCWSVGLLIAFRYLLEVSKPAKLAYFFFKFQGVRGK